MADQIGELGLDVSEIKLAAMVSCRHRRPNSAHCNAAVDRTDKQVPPRAGSWADIERPRRKYSSHHRRIRGDAAATGIAFGVRRLSPATFTTFGAIFILTIQKTRQGSRWESDDAARAASTAVLRCSFGAPAWIGVDRFVVKTKLAVANFNSGVAPDLRGERRSNAISGMWWGS